MFLEVTVVASHKTNVMIILTYVDDCIIFGPSMENIIRFVDSMKNRDKKFVLTDKGYNNKLLGR